MTGTVSNRQFGTSLEGEIDQVARSGESAMLLLIDIDHFKRVNDSYGHGAGDEVIRAIGRTLKCVRPMNLVAHRRRGIHDRAAELPSQLRRGGVPTTIHLAIESCRIEVNRHVRLSVTTPSVGNAFAPRWVRSSARLWMERADQQLYRAKAAGRNRHLHGAASALGGQQRGTRRIQHHVGVHARPPGFHPMSTTTPDDLARLREPTATGRTERPRVFAITSGRAASARRCWPPISPPRWPPGQQVRDRCRPRSGQPRRGAETCSPGARAYDVFTGRGTLDQALLTAPGDSRCCWPAPA